MAVARAGEPVALAPGTLERMARSRAVVERVLERDDAVYGMTTGLGAHKRHRVDADSVAFNRELIATTASATGRRRRRRSCARACCAC